MQAEPQQEHQWLAKLVGEWTYESECNMGPDQPAMKSSGSETVRSFGGVWTIGDMEGSMDGKTWNAIMTLGYDPLAGHFVGTFIGSMMTYLWVYRGSLDAAQRVLTLDADGPNFTDGKMAKYQDIIEFISDDHRTLSSQMLGEDGQWRPFMKAHYRRKT